jgi:hypothetical protein
MIARSSKIAVASLWLWTACDFPRPADVEPDTLAPDDAPNDHDTPPVQCPSTYTQVGGGCYRFVAGSTVGWTEAESICEGDGFGCHLVGVGDQAEMNVLLTLVMQKVGDFWIGVNDRGMEGTYRNVTGDMSTFLPWRTQPTTDAQDCVSMWSDNGEIKGQDCDDKDEPVCECDGMAPMPGSF